MRLWNLAQNHSASLAVAMGQPCVFCTYTALRMNGLLLACFMNRIVEVVGALLARKAEATCLLTFWSSPVVGKATDSWHPGSYSSLYCCSLAVPAITKLAARSATSFAPTATDFGVCVCWEGGGGARVCKLISKNKITLVQTCAYNVHAQTHTCTLTHSLDFLFLTQDFNLGHGFWSLVSGCPIVRRLVKRWSWLHLWRASRRSSRDSAIFWLSTARMNCVIMRLSKEKLKRNEAPGVMSVMCSIIQYHQAV